MSTIKISEATKVYGGKVTALHGIDLTVQDREMLVLVGPSGCGKSTLLRMIAGFESITTGTIVIVIRKCVKERFQTAPSQWGAHVRHSRDDVSHFLWTHAFASSPKTL